MKVLVLTVLFVFVISPSLQQEPVPCSSCEPRFEYDYRLLTRLIELETAQRDALTLISQLRADNVELRREVNDHVSVGATYTRWGKSTCQTNGTELVYSGLTAGSDYSHTGAAANVLCLTKFPLWNKYDDAEHGGGLVYGAEYEYTNRNRQYFFGREIRDQDPPCAVCRTRRSSFMMIPGRNRCPDGWTLEYHGYLSAGATGHNAATEFICLDADPEVILGGSANNNGKLFYFSEVRCGSSSLCPPYINGRELTCVVCSK